MSHPVARAAPPPTPAVDRGRHDRDRSRRVCPDRGAEPPRGRHRRIDLPQDPVHHLRRRPPDPAGWTARQARAEGRAGGRGHVARHRIDRTSFEHLSRGARDTTRIAMMLQQRRTSGERLERHDQHGASTRMPLRGCAAPCSPAQGRPSSTKQQLIPVPTDAKTKPIRPMPNRASANAAPRTSASTAVTPRSAHAVARSPTGMTTSVSTSPTGDTSSGTATPTPESRTSDAAASSATTSRRRSCRSSGTRPRAGDLPDQDSPSTSTRPSSRLWCHRRLDADGDAGFRCRRAARR